MALSADDMAMVAAGCLALCCWSALAYACYCRWLDGRAVAGEEACAALDLACSLTAALLACLWAARLASVEGLCSHGPVPFCAGAVAVTASLALGPALVAGAKALVAGLGTDDG